MGSCPDTDIDPDSLKFYCCVSVSPTLRILFSLIVKFVSRAR